MNARIQKYLLKPNQDQAHNIDKIIDQVNFVKDLCVERKDQQKASVSSKKLLDSYIADYPYLAECDYSALINALFQISKSNVSQRKKRSNSYTTTYIYAMKKRYPIGDKKVYLPKIGWTKYVCSKCPPPLLSITKMTIIKEYDGKFYLCVHYNHSQRAEDRVLSINSSIGLDYSSTHFMVDCYGNKYDIPHFYRDAEEDIRRLKKGLNKKIPGSKNHELAQRKLIKKYHQIANSRRDFLHKLSASMADKYDYVFVENLDMGEMSRERNLAKATLDNSYSTFIQFLDYKLRDRGKILLKISRWFPSSKMCNTCGFINSGLKKHQKQWMCEKCKTVHDRDVNAAINIKNEGLRLLTFPLGERIA